LLIRTGCVLGILAITIDTVSTMSQSMKTRVPDLNLEKIGYALIALSVPFCGYFGARKRNEGMLCCFCTMSYCQGVMQCMTVSLGVFLIAMCFGFNAVLQDCDPNLPDEQQVSCNRTAFREACKTYDRIYQNITGQQVGPGGVPLPQGVTNPNLQMADEDCYDLLHEWSTIIAWGLVVASLLLCCGICLHCASGYYGHRLYRDLKSGDFPSMVDSSDSDEEK